MPVTDKLQQDKLQQYIEYTANNTEWLRIAMTHKSYAKKQGEDDKGNYERLEFVGDAVVDLVVANILFDKFPNDSEGNLSRKRASLVNEDSLYNLAMRLKLDECVLVDDSLEFASLRLNKRLLASCFEALIGAIYKDSGFDRAYEWVQKIYLEHAQLDFSEHDFVKDYKTRLQEYIQEKMKITPVYQLLSISGPDHKKVFTVQVLAGSDILGEGAGESKKIAEQMAAEQALQRFQDGV